MATTLIKDIPQELLLKVVKCIQHLPQTSNYRKTLYNLCLVKAFSPAATDFLYGGNSAGTNSLLFFRMIIQRPRLAALVHSLTLVSHDFEPHMRQYHKYKSDMAASDGEVFVSSIKAS
jgi:hypothetical protein